MIKSKAELSREIEKTSSAYTDEELFSSPYFYDLLQQTISAVCHKLNRIPRINAFCSVEDDTTASTDGNNVIINTLGPLIREMPTSWEKYVNIFGHITHECGHVLYTSFKDLNPLRSHWTEGEFKYYPDVPKVEGAQEFADYLNSHPNYRKLYVHEMRDLVNIMEDVYIENRLYENFDGLCSAGLHKSNDEKYRLSNSVEELIAMFMLGALTPLSVAKCIIQIKKLGYEPKRVGGKLPTIVQKCKDFIDEGIASVETELDKLSWESDGLKRCELFNIIFVKLRKLLPEPDNNQDFDFTNSSNDESQENQGENGDYSDSQVEKKNAMSTDAAKQNGMSEEAKGNGSPVDSSKPNKAKSEENKQKADKFSHSEDACKDELKKASKAVAKEACEAQDEENHSKELQEESKEIEKKNSSERGRCNFAGYRIVRESKKDLNIDSYKKEFNLVQKKSKSLIRKLGAILKENERDSYESGLIMGQRFNSKDVFHNDGKYFSRINEPDGQIEAVFGILVDMSGSMNGAKITSARKTAILLEDALRNLHIPLLICGHSSQRNDCIIHPFVDFNTNDGCDKYRLSNIYSYGCNIDGAAITYMADRLIKRPEKLKVLIVISDGQPCSCSFYSNNDCDEDTRLAVEHYRKKGVTIFGAIIDEMELVSKIYSDKYSFDCSDEKLETQLIKLIKREISLLK